MSFSAKRDVAVANQVNADRDLMCSASGCPNRWSLNFGKPLCRWHQFSEPHQWPQVTQEQLDAETDRAVAAVAPRLQATVKHWTLADKRALLQRLAGLFSQPRNPRAWIGELRIKAHEGRPLTAAVREMLHDALPVSASPMLDAQQQDADLQNADAKRDRQNRIAQYAAERGIRL